MTEATVDLRVEPIPDTVRRPLKWRITTADGTVVERSHRRTREECESLAHKIKTCPTCWRQYFAGEFGPDHDSSTLCRSGKRPHCACDACF